MITRMRFRNLLIRWGDMMGMRLMQYYKYISEQGGIQGKIKLAQVTKIPSTSAAIVTDDEEKIALFKKTVSEITGKDAPEF